ncbi:putative quinol monooxygenase [Rhodococcus globerulus]|uniref:Antibiotic biosynthesis monooxygenase n=1 Tax=Rhodococcus globerulus TaxID=33008 RepID=A0ABU4C4K5_RHOGO|nr:antibiotic biosynthesis monooxygenase [Rhodococcus globerulus]MDV6271335.1 antibiotic biosynthesis monooxygenase [Rhodococcus globerulus]
MYITISRFRVEGDGETFDKWLLPLADKMRALPGNVLYRVLHDPLDPQARVLTEVWETEEDHLAHLVDLDHVEIIAIGSEKGMRDMYVHHWSKAEGHIERGRSRTEQRLADRTERGEMYRLIDEFRVSRGLSTS